MRSYGGMDPEPLTPSFWSGDHASAGERVVTVFECTSSDDLHSDVLEVHPRATNFRLLSINIRSGMQSRHRDESVGAT
jgi:hypothetical protein